MARLSMALAALVVALGVATLGLSHMSFAAGQAENMEHHMQYTGRVISFNYTNDTLVVKGKEGDKTFDATDAIMAQMVQPKENVLVRYHDSNGKMVASSVKVVG